MTTSANTSPAVSMPGTPAAIAGALQAASTAPVEFTSYLDQEEASAFLFTLGVRRAPKTLQKQRVTGGGPPFMRICNRIVYEQQSLRAWALAQRSPPVTSTSELSAMLP